MDYPCGVVVHIISDDGFAVTAHTCNGCILFCLISEVIRDLNVRNAEVFPEIEIDSGEGIYGIPEKSAGGSYEIRIAVNPAADCVTIIRSGGKIDAMYTQFMPKLVVTLCITGSLPSKDPAI